MLRSPGSKRSSRMDNLSVSKISTGEMCPERFRLQYVARIPTLAVGKLHAGRVVHALIERMLKLKARGETAWNRGEIDDYYLKEWEKQKAIEESKSWFLAWNWEDKPESDYREFYRGLPGLFYDEVLPEIVPRVDHPTSIIYVEHAFEMTLSSAVGPFPLKGVLDCLDHQDVYLDWKTAEEKLSAFTKKPGVQIHGYGEWHHRFTKKPAMVARKVFLVARKSGRHVVETVTYDVNEEHRAFFRRRAAAVWEMYRKNVFTFNTGGWWCSEDWCPFWNECAGRAV